MILLFHLAGSLIFAASNRCGSNGTVDAEKFGRFWSESPVADRLYSGQCTPEEFAVGAVAEWSLNVSPERFLAAFGQWLIGPYSGAFELLAKLSERYVLACLSNTNEPEPQCYRFVLKAMDAQHTDVIFFDDSRECVDGARAVGLQAH